MFTLTPMKAVFSILFMLVVSCNFAYADGKQKVNPELLKRMELYEPQLQKVGERTHAVIGYAYSNYAYIEGDDGIIVIDSGFFSGQAEKSIADYRNQISGKPIAAIIYTHSHIDHTGGAIAIMAGQNTNVPVYGPEGWERWVDESFSNLRPAIFRRIFMQMGMVLPYGEEGTIGNGINPSPVVDGSSRLDFPPTISVDKPLDVTIAGVRLKIVPQQGDIPENLYVWLPDDEILFVGDIPLHATFPAVETVRFEAARDPRAHIDSLNKVLEFDPEYVIPGHGRVLLGKDDIQDVALANRDVVEFLIDQVDRHYVNGLSSDQIIDRLKLPKHLANHPDLQPFYHRVEWMIKTMYFKRAGFVGESMDYLSLTNSEEAKRLVPLLGGTRKVRAQAQKALDDDDPRWAARLATFALEVDQSDHLAKKIRQAAFLRIAQTTESSNERNILLSIIREENGELNWKAIFSKGDYEIIQTQDTDTILKMMKSRFRAEDADGVDMRVRVLVKGSEPRFYRVRNNVLIFSEAEKQNSQTSITLERDTLDRIAANMTTWSEALETGAISVTSGLRKVKKLVSLIE